jgi:hypothetical protein
MFMDMDIRRYGLMQFTKVIFNTYNYFCLLQGNMDSCGFYPPPKQQITPYNELTHRNGDLSISLVKGGSVV